MFDSIGTSVNNMYTDTGLMNGSSYCYYVRTSGNYNLMLYPFTLFNNSQLACNKPIDTIKPCTPALSIDTPCNSFNNYDITLQWNYPKSCDKDVVQFRVFYRKNLQEPWVQLDSVSSSVNVYVDHKNPKNSIAGCYAVAAVDSFLNQSYLTNARCVDNCPYYAIPNVFTPNNDGRNDLLNPFPYRFIDKIDITIYNRWGMEVFHTNETDINWTGQDKNNGSDCVAGVYFFICDVFESYLDGTVKRTIKGSVQLIRN